jgi:hypothetical protein
MILGADERRALAMLAKPTKLGRVSDSRPSKGSSHVL